MPCRAHAAANRLSRPVLRALSRALLLLLPRRQRLYCTVLYIQCLCLRRSLLVWPAYLGGNPPSWVAAEVCRTAKPAPTAVRSSRLGSPSALAHDPSRLRLSRARPGSGIVCNTRRCALSAGISTLRPPTRRKSAAFTVPGGGAPGLQTRATWHARKLQIHAAASRLARDSANRLDTESAGLQPGLDKLQLRSAENSERHRLIDCTSSSNATPVPLSRECSILASPLRAVHRHRDHEPLLVF